MFDVITIGTATRDVFLHGPLFRVVRDSRHLRQLGFPTGEAQCFALGGKMEIAAPEITVGGGAANTAVTFARQGLRAAALYKIGAHDYGAEVVRELQKEKVASFPALDRKKATAYSAILLAKNGERTILNYRGASEDLALREIPFRKLRAGAVYIVPGRIPLPVVLAITRHFSKQNALVAMDISRHYLEMGPRKLKPLLNLMDVVHVNREEGSYLTGIPYANERGIFRKFDELIRGIAILTDGPKGVSVSDGKTIYRAAVFPEKKIADRTGAGDAFGSGFVAGLLRRRDSRLTTYDLRPTDIEFAIRLASANATSVVEHIGAQPGILTKKGFADKRWRHLKISSIKVS